MSTGCPEKALREREREGGSGGGDYGVLAFILISV